MLLLLLLFCPTLLFFFSLFLFFFLNKIDVQSSLVEHYKVKALYLEPGRVVDRKNVGMMAVDGERVEYAPMGVEVFRGLFNIICYD